MATDESDENDEKAKQKTEHDDDDGREDEKAACKSFNTTAGECEWNLSEQCHHEHCNTSRQADQPVFVAQAN